MATLNKELIEALRALAHDRNSLTTEEILAIVEAPSELSLASKLEVLMEFRHVVFNKEQFDNEIDLFIEGYGK